MNEQQKKEIQAVMDRYTALGLPLEGGWQVFSKLMVEQKIPPPMTSFIRLSFYSGAAHLLAILFNGLSDDKSTEASPKDVDFMQMIHNELLAFGETAVYPRGK